MEILRGIEARPATAEPSVVTVGAFAVVHTGHRALLTQVVEKAAHSGALPAVVTFDRHPLETLAPDRAPCRLCTVEQRMQRLEEVGVRRVLLLGFTPELSSLEPEDFVLRALVDALHARAIVVGEDFRFGHGRAGDVALLRQLGTKHGFEVEAFALRQAPGDGKVSTTEIRKLVLDGDVQGAARLLGHNHRISGQVVRGDGQGREIGFPTANLQPPEATCLPGAGIYSGWWVEDGRRLPGVVYVGDKPTLSGRGTGLEIHIFDLDEDLYGRGGQIELVSRLRPDRAFPSVEELVEQIHRDVGEARRQLMGDAR